MAVDGIMDVAVGDVHVWDQNPRTITTTRFEALKKSMVEDPDMMQARPLIALRDGRVIAGNMRLRAALELGWETIPTVYVDMTEEKALTWAMRDNISYGEWDDQGVAELLYDLDQKQQDLSLTGFPEDDVLRLLESVAQLRGDPASGAGGDGGTERGADLAIADVSIGDPTHTPQRGEIWKVGPHILFVGDVYDGWPTWVPYLEGDALFVPYPTPTLPLTERAERSRLVMVQPDPWLAGHLLDKYAAVKGVDDVRTQTADDLAAEAEPTPAPAPA